MTITKEATKRTLRTVLNLSFFFILLQLYKFLHLYRRMEETLAWIISYYTEVSFIDYKHARYLRKTWSRTCVDRLSFNIIPSLHFIIQISVYIVKNANVFVASRRYTSLRSHDKNIILKISMIFLCDRSGVIVQK